MAEKLEPIVNININNIVPLCLSNILIMLDVSANMADSIVTNRKNYLIVAKNFIDNIVIKHKSSVKLITWSDTANYIDGTHAIRLSDRLSNPSCIFDIKNIEDEIKDTSVIIIISNGLVDNHSIERFHDSTLNKFNIVPMILYVQIGRRSNDIDDKFLSPAEIPKKFFKGLTNTNRAMILHNSINSYIIDARGSLDYYKSDLLDWNKVPVISYDEIIRLPVTTTDLVAARDLSKHGYYYIGNNFMFHPEYFFYCEFTREDITYLPLSDICSYYKHTNQRLRFNHRIKNIITEIIDKHYSASIDLYNVLLYSSNSSISNYVKSRNRYLLYKYMNTLDIFEIITDISLVNILRKLFEFIRIHSEKKMSNQNIYLWHVDQLNNIHRYLHRPINIICEYCGETSQPYLIFNNFTYINYSCAKCADYFADIDNVYCIPVCNISNANLESYQQIMHPHSELSTLFDVLCGLKKKISDNIDLLVSVDKMIYSIKQFI